MNLFLFIFWLILAAVSLHRFPFIRESGLHPKWMTGLFLLKVGAGIAYGLFHQQLPNYATTADTWKYFYESVEETRLLRHYPVQFFSSLFSNTYDTENGLRFFSTHNSFWNDLRHNYMVKFIAVLNLFSLSNYYVNVIFYNLLTFFGAIAFIRILSDIFKGKILLIALSTFLIPSFLFWTSGIHKDGLVFSYICLLTYPFHFYLLKKEKILRSVLLMMLWLALLLPLRNYVALALFPALIAWYWSAQMVQRKWLPFLFVSAAGILLFFTTKYFYPKIDFPVTIVVRQQEFKELGGKSMLYQPRLESHFKSFLKNMPNALNHVLFRPYLNEGDSIFYWFSALEIWMIWALLMVWCFLKHESVSQYNTLLFFLMIAGIMMLLTGYIVPQTGALVRYRSIYLPFLVVPLLASIRSKYIK
jgi:hypothetical protein